LRPRDVHLNPTELGFFAQITRFPADGVGIAVLTNEDLGEYTNNIMKYRLIDEVFGLDPVDWDSRCPSILPRIHSI
jgi:hypothetical protein